MSRLPRPSARVRKSRHLGRGPHTIRTVKIKPLQPTSSINIAHVELVLDTFCENRGKRTGYKMGEGYEGNIRDKYDRANKMSSAAQEVVVHEKRGE